VEAYTFEEKLAMRPRSMAERMDEVWARAVGYLQEHGLPDRRNRWQREGGLQWREFTEDDDLEVHKGVGGEFWTTHLDGSIDEETPRWIALHLRALIGRWHKADETAKRTGKLEDIDRVERLTWKISQLQRDLFWKQYEKSAEKGIAVSERLAGGRKDGTRTTHENRVQRDRELAELINARISRAAELTPPAIAKLVLDLDHDLVLPKALEKKVRSLADAGLIQAKRTKKLGKG
jgi:hypothetical protein